MIQSKSYDMAMLAKKVSELEANSNNFVGFELQKAEMSRLNSSLAEKLRLSEEKCKELTVLAAKNGEMYEELKEKLGKVGESISQSPPTAHKQDAPTAIKEY